MLERDSASCGWSHRASTQDEAIMQRAVLSATLSLALVASLFAVHVQGAVPLAARVSRLEMVAPGRVRVDVAVDGLQPALLPTMVARMTVNGQSTEGWPFPVVAAHTPAVIDLPAGRVRVGGDASVAEFTPVPPLTQDLPIALEVTVRQGDQTVTAKQTGVLLLPIVIVPGYMNHMGRPNTAAISILQQRGYRSTGASPSLFWFTYTSRRLDLEAASHALAAYVRSEVLPKTYAARINVVGYSLGGLLVRWNIAFEPGWDRLVSRFVMVGVPNEGVVMPYVYGWYTVTSSLARTPAARNLLPTFPFWRSAHDAPWCLPPDVRNRQMDTLNAHPLPDTIRAYAMYGNRPLDSDGRGTWAGITGELPRAAFSYGPGDGIVLTASVLGLPINGGVGLPGFADRLVMKVDLGTVGHLSLLESAMPRIADVLADETSASGNGGPRGEMRGRAHAGDGRIGMWFPEARFAETR